MSKTVFITGSSSGIGKETAYLFSEAGWNIILTYYGPNKKEGEQVKKECERLGADSVLLLKLDLMKDASIKSSVAAAKKKYGKIDVLINNAGILVQKPLARQTPKEIELQIRTNFEGLVKMTYFALPIVNEAIINIASRRGMLTIPDAPVYGASKWAVRGFTKDLALEYPKLHILAVNPSLTATGMTKNKGLEPSRVAQVVFDSAVYKIKSRSGDDINVWEIYGLSAT